MTLVLPGCSVQHWAVDKVGDAVAGDGKVIASDDDPELIRAAAPFDLKLTEGLLAASPENQRLLLSAASGFTQYSYAFVQLDADLLEDRDYGGATVLRQRARRMYLRARGYALRGLEARHPGFTAQLKSDPAAAAHSLQAADMPWLYWATVSWAGAISQAKDDPALIGDLPTVDALADRAAELDPDFDAGALQSFLITYEMARQGRVEVAREHFARALTLSARQSAAPYVGLAESVAVAQRARGEYLQLLDQALAIDADKTPNVRLENLIMQKRARWLRQRADDLFLPEAGTMQPEGTH